MMKFRDLVLRFLKTFAVVLVVTALVTLCWNHFVKGNVALIDWETSFRFALVFAIVIPITQIRSK